MSTLEPTVDPNVQRAATQSIDDPAIASSSIVSVLTTSDHKVIGRLLVGSAMAGLLIVAVLGALLGAERIDGDATFLRESALTQLFAGYRVGLVEVVILPLMLGISVLAVPLQLGARSLAFPRAAALGFWAWFGGVVLVIIALANNGGPFGGQPDMVGLYVAANALALIGLTVIAATIATSVLTTRAPGMRMKRVPLFSWSALVMSIGLVLALPVAVGVHVFVYVDYRYTQAAFGAATGIFDWTFYLLTGPTLALFALPAIGFFAELVPVVFKRRMPLRGVVLGGLSLVGVAAFIAIAQQPVIGLPWSGRGLSLSNLGTKIADLVTFSVFALVPVLGVLIVLGVGALAAKPVKVRGETVRPNLIAPFAFGVFGIIFILIGMAAMALNGVDDLALQGTVFEEGATIYIVYGAVIAGFGAVAYWMPKVTGSVLPTTPTLGLALLAALATALASLPYLVAGFIDQPASAASWDNDGPGEVLNLVTTAGHALMALVGLAFAGLVIPALAGLGRKPAGADGVSDDPWSGHTLEWSITSPAPVGNFDVTPTVMSPEPLLDLRAAPDFPSDPVGADPVAAGTGAAR